MKYVINAEYWLCRFLEKYALTNQKQVAQVYEYIVSQTIRKDGRPSLTYAYQYPRTW